MSKNLGSSMIRKANRLHVDPFQGRKLKRRNNRKGRFYQQLVPIYKLTRSGKRAKEQGVEVIIGFKTITHRLNGDRLNINSVK